MEDFKEGVVNCIKEAKGSGRFVSSGTATFRFPQLEIKDLGELSYPVNTMQANALIQVAQKAPFGKGRQTIIDNNVRSVWEIDAANLYFTGGQWAVFLESLLSKIKPQLGIEDYTISAHLYKMLIYEKGGFFLSHKDSEKEKGMFATLVIGLPCKHTGGELVVSFEGKEEVIDFAEGSADYKISYAAFYADCDHEIKPVTSGHRVCLVYNLVQQKVGNEIHPVSVKTHAIKLASLLTAQEKLGDTKPYIVLLGHQYTPENFGVNALKLNDRTKAAILLEAAQKAGFYSKMCLVTSYISGAPTDGGGGYYGDDDEEDEDAEMEEVYEESLYIEHWEQDGLPAFNKVGFEEEDLIASFDLKEGEPIVKESTGYMGNYGPDLMHWYHYGAVMIWSPQTNAQLLLQQNATSKLNWIDHFNKSGQQPSDYEVATIETILLTGMADVKPDKSANYNAIANWVINRKDESFFVRQSDELLSFYFTYIDTSLWIQLMEFCPADTNEKIVEKITQNITLPVMQQLLSLTLALTLDKKWSSLALLQIKNIPNYLLQLPISQDKHLLPNGCALRNLLAIEKKLPQQENWINSVAGTLVNHKIRNYLHQVLIPEMMALTEATGLAATLLAGCQQYLQQQADNEPQLPTNWTRQVPTNGMNRKEWQLLQYFLDSPDQQFFDYRHKQNERSLMENAIAHVVIDLKTETIKKGSPHTLRITKTQEEYHRQMQQWKEDVLLLSEINQKIKTVLS